MQPNTRLLQRVEWHRREKPNNEAFNANIKLALQQWNLLFIMGTNATCTPYKHAHAHRKGSRVVSSLRMVREKKT